MNFQPLLKSNSCYFRVLFIHDFVGQPFTYDLFESLKLSEFGRRRPWFAESAIKVDRVRGLQLMDPPRKVALRGHYGQMKMILHQDITMHFDPVALCAFSQIAQKLRPISIIPENLFPRDNCGPVTSTPRRLLQAQPAPHRKNATTIH